MADETARDEMEKIDVFFHDDMLKHDNGHNVFDNFQDLGFLDVCGAKPGFASSPSVSRGPGVTILVLSWIITLYTLWQMVEMHEMLEGKWFDRYHGQEAFGRNLGLWIVVPQQLIVEVSVDIIYMVTGRKSLQKFYKIVCNDSCPSAPHTSACNSVGLADNHASN